MKLVYDIECDALDATRVWCLIAYNLETEKLYKYTCHNDKYPSIEDGVALLSNAEVLIGHNIIGYDNVQLDKLYGSKLNEIKCYDTWVMSQVLRYRRTHRHALEGWGENLGYAKIHFDKEKFPLGDDPEIFAEMFEYCTRDVLLNVKVYYTLMEEFKQLFARRPAIRRGMEIEHDVAKFNAYVKTRGWHFDMEKAKDNRARMQKRMEEIEAIVHPQLGQHKVFIDKAPKQPKYKKNGEYTAITARQLSEFYGKTVDVKDTHIHAAGVDFQRFKMVDTKLSQMDLIKEWLLAEKGWKPDDYTVKKINGKWVKQSPKFTETSMSKLGELGGMISEYYTIRNRASVIDGWFDQVKEGRLHGDMWTIGTPTFRVRHKTIVNLPGVDTEWGKELRELLAADEGMVVVGADSSGNQLRALAHYVGDDAFTHSVCEGNSADGTDAHTRNAEILGVSRSVAKTYLYAYLFGAGFGKLGATITGKPNVEAGKKSAEKFGKGIKGLQELKDKVQGIWKQTSYAQGIGWFPALDGRPVFCDSDHQALNYLLQSAEGITCKAALSYAWRKIDEEKLRAEPRLFYHDELAFVAHPDDAARVGEILQESFREAPKEFGVNIMDGGDYVIGQSYADVH